MYDCRTRICRYFGSRLTAFSLSYGSLIREHLFEEQLARHARDLTCSRNIQITHDPVARRPDGRQELVERLPFPAQIGEPAATLENLNLPIEDVDRLRDLPLEPL